MESYEWRVRVFDLGLGICGYAVNNRNSEVPIRK